MTKLLVTLLEMGQTDPFCGNRLGRFVVKSNSQEQGSNEPQRLCGIITWPYPTLLVPSTQLPTSNRALNLYH